MSFPVVFQGWPTTPGQEIAGTPAILSAEPGRLPNALFEIDAKAPQQPVLGESWAIEALLLDFLVEYKYEVQISVKGEYEQNKAKKKALENQITLLGEKFLESEAAVARAEGAEAQIRALWVKEGSPTPSVLAKEVEESVAAVHDAKAAVKAVKVETEGVNLELADLAISEKVLGRAEVLAQLNENPLYTRIKLTGPRDTSLLSGLSSFERRTIALGAFAPGESAEQENTIQEHYSQRIDLDNPAQALGGDQLALALTSYVPIQAFLPTSNVVLDLKIAVIDAHLQCSVAGSLART